MRWGLAEDDKKTRELVPAFFIFIMFYCRFFVFLLFIFSAVDSGSFANSWSKSCGCFPFNACLSLKFFDNCFAILSFSFIGATSKNSISLFPQIYENPRKI